MADENIDSSHCRDPTISEASAPDCVGRECSGRVRIIDARTDSEVFREAWFASGLRRVHGSTRLLQSRTVSSVTSPRNLASCTSTCRSSKNSHLSAEPGGRTASTDGAGHVPSRAGDDAAASKVVQRKLQCLSAVVRAHVLTSCELPRMPALPVVWAVVNLAESPSA